VKHFLDISAALEAEDVVMGTYNDSGVDREVRVTDVLEDGQVRVAWETDDGECVAFEYAHRLDAWVA
jgi:hypothetical protein